MPKTTTKLILDTRYETKEKKYPVRLRITHERNRYYIPMGKSYTEIEWAHLIDQETPLKGDKKKLYDDESRAVEILDKMLVFSIDLFKKKFSSDVAVGTLRYYFDQYIKNCSKVSTADGYEVACKSFEEFKKGIQLHDVTSDTLKKYEKWALTPDDKGNVLSKTTISIYVRKLKTIVNKARQDGDFPSDLPQYPFGQHKYQLPTSKKKKDPLSLEEFIKLKNYKTDNKLRAQARDFWLLLFYLGGRNPIDVWSLKFDQIQDGNIIFEHREKTKDSDPDQEPIMVEIHEEIQEIIDRWKVKSGPYVFGIINDRMDERKKKTARDQFGRKINERLDTIQKQLKLKTNPRLGNSRHSAANIAIQSGHSIEDVRVMLSHGSTETTQIYLKSLSQNVRNKTINTLRIAHIKTA